MKKPLSNDKPLINKITHIEVSEERVGLRTALLAVVFAITLGAMAFGLNALLTVEPGFQEIKSLSSAKDDPCRFFTLYYDIGAGDEKAADERKAVRKLYTDAAAEAYRLFDAQTAYDECNNIHYINGNINADIKVEPALYDALFAVKESGARYIYLAPVYELYYSLFACTQDAEASQYDPARSGELRAFAGEVAKYANDPASIDIALMGDNTVRLTVSDEYIKFARDNGVSTYIDLFWLKNAFAVDIIADALIEGGYTRGTVMSFDGFIRHMSASPDVPLEYTFPCVTDTGVSAGEKLRYTNPVSIAYLHSYPLGQNGLDMYYVYEDGAVASPYIDARDGLYRCALTQLIGCSGLHSCGELALKLAGAFIAQAPDEAALSLIEGEGIELVYGP